MIAMQTTECNTRNVALDKSVCLLTKCKWNQMGCDSGTPHSFQNNFPMTPEHFLDNLAALPLCIIYNRITFISFFFLFNISPETILTIPLV